MGLIKVKNKPPFCDISACILSLKCGCHTNLIWLSLVIQALLVKIKNNKVRPDYVADRPCGWLTLLCSFTLVEIRKDI